MKYTKTPVIRRKKHRRKHPPDLLEADATDRQELARIMNACPTVRSTMVDYNHATARTVISVETSCTKYIQLLIPEEK